MRNCFALSFLLMAICSLVVAPACRRQPQSRQYEENSTDETQALVQPQVPPHAMAWQWDKPNHWREEGSTGLRLVTFSIADPEGSGQCTLIPLSGDGGGVQANVQRWMEQLQLRLLSPQELTDFLGRQKKMRTEDGLPVMVIDFTTLNERQQPSGTSILAAMILGVNQTLFVKLSGGKALLEKSKENFYRFCQSMSLGA